MYNVCVSLNEIICSRQVWKIKTHESEAARTFYEYVMLRKTFWHFNETNITRYILVDGNYKFHIYITLSDSL